MTTIVIMPGGFHPFHAGHYALYQSAQRAFPDAEVYVAATNDTSARPFPFPVKEKLAKLAGVEAGHFVQVKSPFKAEEITAKFDPARDTLIFVRSEKDSTKPPQPGGVKKDGSPSYLQPLLGAKKLEPFARHAYMAYLPTVEFGPGMTSATEIRTAWPQLNEKRKTALVMSLYPRTQGNAKLAATVVGLLDAAIGTQVDEDLSRRGFLRGLGAAAVAGAAGSAMAQSQPVDVSQAFANMRKDDPRVQHNKDIDEMARAIYDQIVTLRGQPIDRRQQQMWMTIAREKAAEKLAKYAPGRPAAQPQSSGFPSQGSERRVSRNIDNFESQGVAGGLNEFAPDSGGGESGRWYTDDQMTDIVGDGWWEDMDVSGNISKQQMIQQAQAWLDDQGYSVQVLNAKLNDDDMDWFIEGSFHNPGFAKKGVVEGGNPVDHEWYRKQQERQTKAKQRQHSVAEGSEQQWTVTVGTKTGGTSHTMTFTGTKEQAIKKAVERFGTSKNPVVKAVPAKQGVAEGAPIVVAQAPIDVRNPKKAPQPQRYMGDIVPPTKPPSTEKRGVKGRPGQRPMPQHNENNDYLDE